MKRIIAAMTIIPRPRIQPSHPVKRNSKPIYKVYRLNDGKPEVFMTTCQFSAFLFILDTPLKSRSVSIQY